MISDQHCPFNYWLTIPDTPDERVLRFSEVGPLVCAVCTLTVSAASALVGLLIFLVTGAVEALDTVSEALDSSEICRAPLFLPDSVFKVKVD